MSWKEILGLTIWLSGMAYTALCIGIPEIRLNWRGTNIRVGPISSFCFAWFFWGLPVLWVTGWLIGIQSPRLAMLVFFVVFMASGATGYLMDITKDKKVKP